MIQLAAVSKGFGSSVARCEVLAELDLSVAAGEIVALAGPSGSGKTTILALLAGWAVPDSGQVRIVDDTMAPAQRPWSDVAIVPQSLGLLPELTIEENLTVSGVGPRHVPAPDLRAVTDLLGITHLTRRFPDEVSLGEQQRAAIVRATVGLPKVLLADEPIAHQNERFAHNVMESIRQRASSGTAVLIATHNEIAFDYCDRILRLGEGGLMREA